MRLAVAAAGIWALVLLVGAFVVPVYGTARYITSGTSADISPGPVRLTLTVVDVNGLAGAVEMALPLLVTLVLGIALYRGVDRFSLVVAWSATGLLASFNLLALFGIGLLMTPATAALLVGCVMATRLARAAGS
jgi:hypothetical protein